MRAHKSLFAVLALTAACGASDPQPTSPAVSEARQETQSSADATAKAEAKHTCNHAKDPAMAEVHLLMEGKRYEEAADKLAAISAADPKNAKAVQLQGYALHAAGKLDEALVVHQRAAEFPETAGVASYNIACVHALKGDKDAAFAALDRSIAAGFAGAEHMEKDPDMASLKEDARFTAAMDAARAKAASMPASEKDRMKKKCDHPSHASSVH